MLMSWRCRIDFQTPKESNALRCQNEPIWCHNDVLKKDLSSTQSFSAYGKYRDASKISTQLAYF